MRNGTVISTSTDSSSSSGSSWRGSQPDLATLMPCFDLLQDAEGADLPAVLLSQLSAFYTELCGQPPQQKAAEAQHKAAATSTG